MRTRRAPRVLRTAALAFFVLIMTRRLFPEGPMPRVVLAMSGGVDSSVAAWLLKKQGHDVIGLFMRTAVAHDNDAPAHGAPAHKKGCCSAVDAGDARRVADRLDIPFYALDFEAEFGKIIDYFASEYAVGRTPNPCVVCNTWLKFGQLWAFAKQLGRSEEHRVGK